MGLTSSKMSAITGIVFFKEFLLDPGYYPKGGFQKFADCIAERFKDYGGEIIFADEVNTIPLNDGLVSGVITNKNGFINSKYVVSSIDTTKVFKELIKSNTPERKVTDRLVPSGSIFSVYIGLKKEIMKTIDSDSNIWVVNTQNVEGYYEKLKENIDRNIIQLIMMTFPTFKESDKGKDNKLTMEIFTPAPFDSKNYWEKKRENLSFSVLELAKKAIPDLDKYIDLQITATPQTFYRYTYNRNGAAFGWASNKEQTEYPSMTQKVSIRNLFLAGHWTTMSAGQSGVSTVALSGKKAAGIILGAMGKSL